MSGIVGIYYLDCRPVDPADLGRMVDILAHRGPDGAEIWHNGSVGLGHRMLWTTPESLQEKLPLVSRNGDLAITADARIDNRDELIATLGLSDRPTQEIADSQLILAAYEKWGEQCPEKLLGDFAFAIWDGRKQQFFCARDHFGVRPLYYYVSDRTYVFASEIKALLCLSEVPRQLNEIKVADYLITIFHDAASTFYQNILRLPPAHRLTLGREHRDLQSYWQPERSRELRLKSNELYAEEFGEIFAEAVRCRLRRALPIGSLLSGGLDSSSITCVTRNLMPQNGSDRLPTFSAIFNRITECDERFFINKVLAHGGYEPHYVHADELSPLTDLDRVFWHEDEAFQAPNLFMRWALYDTARQQGVRILLDGFDGDTTVSHGLGYLKELANEGRWPALTMNLWHLARTNRGDQRLHQLASSYIWHYGFRPRLFKSRIFKRGRRIWQSRPWRTSPSSRQIVGLPAWRVPLKTDFVHRTDLLERHKVWRLAQPDLAQTERERHYRSVTQDMVPFALEVLGKAATAFAIEPRYPFWDKRLVEFCLALPPEQKLYRGWGRMVLRRAMSDIIPEQIQYRRSKMDFLPNLSHGMLSFARKRLDQLFLNDLEIVGDYVDVTAMRRVYDRFISQPTPEQKYDAHRIWQVASLALWLQYTEMSSGPS